MHVPKHVIMNDIQHSLTEDIGAGDVSAALLPADLVVMACILSREPLLVCGRAWVDAVFAAVDATLSIHWLVEEGAWLEQGQVLCEIHGCARSILTAERTALNWLQTLSGTATQTYHYVQALRPYKTQLLDTRKTIPGLRLAQKYAVQCAGGVNHRMGLYDAFLIKENHIKACGSITHAIRMARAAETARFVEVEVETLAELREALAAKPDRILLDNFTAPMLAEAVRINTPKQCPLEASGSIDLANMHRIAQLGIDYISVGAITKSIKAIDLSLLIQDTPCLQK